MSTFIIGYSNRLPAIFVNNLGTKLYNKLPNYLKNSESLKHFKKQLKAVLLQETFYTVDEYLSYV
jgi:hypothetical protein